MRPNYDWANASYDLILDNGNVYNYHEVDCYAKLRDYENNHNPISYIKLLDLKCKPSEKYRVKYLTYICDMLKIKDFTIEDESFTFKAYSCNTKNVLVCSLVRFLVDKLGYKNPALETENLFLKPLLENSKCRYKNKLKRFCYFYKNIGKFDYWHTGHSWKPEDTKIKSTKDWLNINNLNSVNEFFTNK